MSEAAEEIKYLTYWCGRNIEELSREELIEALRYSVRETKMAYDGWKGTQDMYRFFRSRGL